MKQYIKNESEEIFNFEEHSFRPPGIDEINACLKEMGFDGEIVLLLGEEFADILGESEYDVGITKDGELVVIGWC